MTTVEVVSELVELIDDVVIVVAMEESVVELCSMEDSDCFEPLEVSDPRELVGVLPVIGVVEATEVLMVLVIVDEKEVAEEVIVSDVREVGLPVVDCEVVVTASVELVKEVEDEVSVLADC